MPYRLFRYSILLVLLSAVLQSPARGEKSATVVTDKVASDDPEDVAVLRKIKFVYCVLDKNGDITGLVWTHAAPDHSEFWRVKGLRNIQALTLSGHFTDDHLVHLEGMKLLTSLNLSGTDVSDKGLVHLKALAALRSLHLAECKGVSDAGIAQLGGLAELERLYMYNTRVHGEGFKSLQGLKKLRFMDLGYTDIDNDSLPIIAKLTALDDLDVFGTRVTDEGLPRLKPLTRLRYLWVGDMGPDRAGTAAGRGFAEREDRLSAYRGAEEGAGTQ